jgi:hypothetical protein
LSFFIQLLFNLVEYVLSAPDPRTRLFIFKGSQKDEELIELNTQVVKKQHLNLILIPAKIMLN